MAASGFLLGLKGGIMASIIGLLIAIIVQGSFKVMSKAKSNHSFAMAPYLSMGCFIIFNSIAKGARTMKNILRNRTVLGLISITMALIICFGLTPLFNKAIQEKVAIVRVTKDIKKGDLITKDMIQTMSVGGYNLPNEVIKNQENVIGKYALADFCKGDYILSTKLSNEPLTEHAYLYNLDGIKRAISITIKSFAAGLSGKLEHGDIVSIIASDYGEFRKTMIPNELQYVQVLAVTASSGQDRTYQEMKDEDQELPSTVTLLVNQEQAKLLAELEERVKSMWL